MARAVCRPHLPDVGHRQPPHDVVHHSVKDPREQDGAPQAEVHPAGQVLLEPQEEEERLDLRSQKGEMPKFFGLDGFSLDLRSHPEWKIKADNY